MHLIKPIRIVIICLINTLFLDTEHFWDFCSYFVKVCISELELLTFHHKDLGKTQFGLEIKKLLLRIFKKAFSPQRSAEETRQYYPRPP